MLQPMLASIREKIPRAKGALLGLGVVQAWMALMISLAQTQGSVSYGAATLSSDLGAAPVYLAVIVSAQKIAPLFEREKALRIATVVMVAGNLIVAAGLVLPNLPAGFVMEVGLFICGAGTVLAILAWWEIYSTLNPVEVGLYYAGSWLLREAVLILLAGYILPYLIILSFSLPFIAEATLNASRRYLAKEGLAPKIVHKSTTFPWKPMLLVGLYSFAYGCGTWIAYYEDSLFMHLGILAPALIVCAAILLSWRRFNFTTVYRFILPVAMAGLLALLFIPNVDTNAATLLLRTSHTSVFIYVSILLCNLSRRYHISAAWLFSLFNITHIVSLGIGTLVYMALPSLAIVGVGIVCIVFVTFIIISEPTLASDWSITLTDKAQELGESARLELAVSSLARDRGLSEREHEVLLMLAQGNMPRAIGDTLHIAPGTVEAHVQRIYKKVGVHSREELNDLLKK